MTIGPRIRRALRRRLLSLLSGPELDARILTLLGTEGFDRQATTMELLGARLAQERSDNAGLDRRVAELVSADGSTRAALEELIRVVSRTDRLGEKLIFGDPSRVHIGRDVEVNDTLFNVSSGSVTVESTAFFGHGVSLLTGTHDIALRGLERQRGVPSEGRDIVIGRGAWVASNATVLGPCVIGESAVVAAGAVVTADVPPFMIVAGVPARVVGRVPDAPTPAPDSDPPGPND